MMMVNMTKNNLVRQVQDRLKDCAAKDVSFAVNVLFAAMTEALRRGERIDVRGFGNFTIRRRPARAARNPQNGASVQLEARRVPFFKVGRELQKRMNSPNEQ
jgi:integration host factor beta subunit